LNKRLNLASHPFTNRTLPWLVSLVLILISLVALGVIFQTTTAANSQAAIVQHDVDGLNKQLDALLKLKNAVKNNLTPEQKRSLASAHELVDRKSFSWIRLFADLEEVMPDGVRVSRIAVREVHKRSGQTVANLELAVVARTPTVVTDMIADMDRQGIFQAELRSENLQKGKGENGSAEYDLEVQYRPRAGYASAADDNPRASLKRPSADEDAAAQPAVKRPVGAANNEKVVQ